MEHPLAIAGALRILEPYVQLLENQFGDEATCVDTARKERDSLLRAAWNTVWWNSPFALAAATELDVNLVMEAFLECAKQDLREAGLDDSRTVKRACFLAGTAACLLEGPEEADDVPPKEVHAKAVEWVLDGYPTLLDRSPLVDEWVRGWVQQVDESGEAYGPDWDPWNHAMQ